jgi:predicted nucleic acid-binding Zn ribbon protein
VYKRPELKAQNINVLIKKYIENHSLKKNFDKYSVFGKWEEVVGKKIAEIAKPEKIIGDTLFVRVSIPAWKTELNFFRKELDEKIRKITNFELKKMRII